MAPTAVDPPPTTLESIRDVGWPKSLEELLLQASDGGRGATYLSAVGGEGMEFFSTRHASNMGCCQNIGR